MLGLRKTLSRELKTSYRGGENLQKTYMIKDFDPIYAKNT